MEQEKLLRQSLALRPVEGIVFDEKDAKLFYHDKCDKYDYLTAVGAGVITGCIDIFLVGAPGNSILGTWTDKQTDNFVMFFAKKNGWKPEDGTGKVENAIKHLEEKYEVNYDQQHNAAAGGNVPGMNTRNHHLKSLAHSPSIVGLFFSILNQFTSTSSFLNNGQLVTIKTDSFELQGGNLIAKLFCGVANWFGHIVSDMAGSSGAKSRGSGVSIPLFELFQLCNFGKLPAKETQNTIATLTTKVFEGGYDARFGVAMAIPVVINELVVKLVWAIRRKFHYRLPVRECIPTVKNQNLRIMLIVAHGTLCVLDVADAGVHSGGNALTFALRLNLIAWYRLTALVLKEVFIRLGIAADAQQYLESYKVINEQLREYIVELEKIDIEKFHKEAEEYENMARMLEGAEDNATLNIILVEQTKLLGLNVPWGDDFNAWMDATDKPLIFD